MTRFNEIRPLSGSQRSTEVLCTQLPDYIGFNLVWQERMRIPLTYGEILEAKEKGDHVIVKVSKSGWLGEKTIEKFSFTKDTKVIIQLAE